jgi:hypothetical protein
MDSHFRNGVKEPRAPVFVYREFLEIVNEETENP